MVHALHEIAPQRERERESNEASHLSHARQLQVRVNETFKKVKHLAVNDRLLVTAVKGK